nr:MAG TPA: hypothetical protein [Caudoviricetes sp.]
MRSRVQVSLPLPEKMRTVLRFAFFISIGSIGRLCLILG